jgi:hypothetical protein
MCHIYGAVILMLLSYICYQDYKEKTMNKLKEKPIILDTIKDQENKVIEDIDHDINNYQDDFELHNLELDDKFEFTNINDVKTQIEADINNFNHNNLYSFYLIDSYILIYIIR